MRDFVQHPGARLVAAKLRALSRQALKKQLDADPYTEADEIKRNQQLRYVLNVLIPKILQDIVNFDPAAIDKQVAPKRRWSVMEWFRR